MVSFNNKVKKKGPQRVLSLKKRILIHLKKIYSEIFRPLQFESTWTINHNYLSIVKHRDVIFNPLTKSGVRKFFIQIPTESGMNDRLRKPRTV
jgi:hypothetical protein